MPGNAAPNTRAPPAPIREVLYTVAIGEKRQPRSPSSAQQRRVRVHMNEIGDTGSENQVGGQAGSG